MRLTNSMDNLEKLLTSLEAAVGAPPANGEGKEFQKKMRMSALQHTAMEMDDEEKEAAAEMFKKKDDFVHKPEMKTAMEMDGEERTKAMKTAMENMEEEDRKLAMDHLDEKDRMAMGMAPPGAGEEDEEKIAMKEDLEKKDTQIASLTATMNAIVAKPYVDGMLKARAERGMKKDQLLNFQKSLFGKTIDEIKSRYEEDKALMGSVNQAVSMVELPFNGLGGAALSAATDDGKDLNLGEMFN